jgi:GTP-binding protein HflX
VPGSPAALEADTPAVELDRIEEDEKDPEEEATPAAVTVIVDHDLTPTQMRNLEKVTGVEVLDRSMVILSIFQRQAQTREAKIQVEIAREREEHLYSSRGWAAPSVFASASEGCIDGVSFDDE